MGGSQHLLLVVMLQESLVVLLGTGHGVDQVGHVRGEDLVRHRHLGEGEVGEGLGRRVRGK